MFHAELVVIAILQQLHAAASLYEAFSAQDIIGSHFGPPSINASFDYVVVGGGTAGLTTAHRLAEDSKYSVAIVEAGSFYELTNSNFSQVPALAANFVGADPRLKNPLVDWVQWTEPLEGFGDRKVLYTSGKTLGGSSARNYMLYMRQVLFKAGQAGRHDANRLRLLIGLLKELIVNGQTMWGTRPMNLTSLNHISRRASRSAHQIIARDQTTALQRSLQKR